MGLNNWQFYCVLYEQERRRWHMPTSTFAKQFVVKPEKANEFVEEMTKKASPTLTKDFSSRLHHEKDLKESLRKALK